MSLLTECKVYLDISDNDRDTKLTALLNAGYSSMTKTADVLALSAFSPTTDPTPTGIDELFKLTLFSYVAAQLETDVDAQAKFMAIYEKNVNTLAMSSAFGDYTALVPPEV